MKLLKKLTFFAAVFAAVLALSISANASPITERGALAEAVSLYETLSGTEVTVPAEIEEETGDAELAKAALLGYINLDDTYYVSEDAGIRRQDFISVLYKAIVLADDSYMISSDEADSILNECYNNAYIDDENRIAYAFMIKQGVISCGDDTDPSAELDEDECVSLAEAVRAGFMKDVTVTVGDADITVGANISTVTDVLGVPNRIDKTEYGFEWYVYNSDYASFFMVGVQADRICAVFSNSADFTFNQVTSGCDMVYTADYEDDRCFRFYPTPDGRVDSILYNPAYRGEDDSAEVVRSKSLLLLDMINANRVKNGRMIYAEDSVLSTEAWLAAIGAGDAETVTMSGYDVFSMYRQLVADDNEILTNDTDYITPLGISSSNSDGGGVTASIISDASREVSAPEITEAETAGGDYGVNGVDEVTTPVLLSPKTENAYNAGDDIVIELAMQAAEKYHIEAFDIENDRYAVNEYVVTDGTTITIPSELFTEGSDYMLTVSSVTENGESLSAEETLISYGSAYDSGVNIIAPYNEGILDDDCLDITWQSDMYHDFGIDIYNELDELVYSGVVRGENEAHVEGLDGGQYFLYVSALRRGTNIIKAQDCVTFTAKVPEPVISEIILDRDEVYYYIYEDEEMGLLYFYDEELVDVEEDGETVTKKKIIRKQVKATSGYRRLDAYRAKPEFTTGDPSIVQQRIVRYDGTVGGAIVSEASKYLGTPYVWGGTSPDGFDCSGLVQYVMQSLGINVDRVAEDQFKNGVSVNRDELQPGDLVFFEQNGYIHHVGIYAGNGMMIHAPHTGDVVKYQSIDTDYYRSEYAGARRVY